MAKENLILVGILSWTPFFSGIAWNVNVLRRGRQLCIFFFNNYYYSRFLVSVKHTASIM